MEEIVTAQTLEHVSCPIHGREGSRWRIRFILIIMVGLKVRMGQGFFDSDPLLRIEGQALVEQINRKGVGIWVKRREGSPFSESGLNKD